MRSYFVVCALFIASFALATSGCGSSRGTTDARDGAGDGQGDGSVDRADVGTGKGGTGGSVGGNGGSAGGGSSGAGGSAGGGSGGSAGDAGGSGGSGGTTDGGMNNDGGPDGATPTCNDGIKNSDETDVDCGGHCGKCGPGGMCVVNADCAYACRADKTCAACNVAADCGGTESECEHRTCTAGVCGSMRDPAGTVLTVQTTGDCKKRQCAADGTVAVVNDDTDVPNDQNACTNDICTTGAPSHTNTPDGSSCGSGNHCQSGTCVGCTVASDCPGSDTACSTRTCSAAGVCGHAFKAAGYKLVDPTAGDCKGLQCDGQGNTQVFNDNADLPVDTNPCTTDECSLGTPSHRPVASGMNCGGSLVCDGASNCVECLSANSCPGMDTECRMRSCILGQCGVTNAAAGTLTAAQTAGDCKKNVCSGGAPIVVNDDLDLPVDNNPCTTDVCTGGMPSNPFVTAGSSCGTSTICDGQGACVSCLTASSCPGTDTECHHRTCTNGACGVVNTPVGTALTTQAAGDCKVVQCDGSGDVRTVNDDADKPVDGKACTDDLCNSGVPSNPNLSSGTACGNGLMCDGQGACVGCLTAANCGTDTPCQTHTCTNGACGVNNAAAGTALPTANQTAGDCKKVQCDGMGQTQMVNDDTDLPVDGNACTKDLCAAGQPSNPAESAGTACGMGGGTKCNGSPTAPACVQCLQASECPGTDTDCHHRTCTSGVCGIANTTDGTAVTNQTAGNCKKDVCMGGAQVTINDDTDLPVDGNGCTMDLCMNGMPSNPSLPANATCNENGGTRCNGSATAPACVQCIMDSQCGPNTECQTHSCSVTGTCVTTNVANGTALMMQTAGDCQKGVCNGTGGTAFAIDNTDVPVDGKTCTDDVCTGGVPSNPPRTAGTACNQSGGVQCNATGSCVQCLQPSDCGTDTACRTFTCSAAGACGSTPAADGKFVSAAPTGNCHTDVCMSGNIVHAVDDNDVPVDGNLCTDDVCTNGTPSNPNVASGVSCGTSLMCNGMGSCVGCITEANCGPPPNACQTTVCMNGMCGFTNVANGTVLATQTAGDCHKDVCMNGSVVSMVDDSDVLVDNNPCTQDLCNAGFRSNPPVGSGVACSVGTGTVCNDSGQCVECLDASTCPGGPDSACHIRTCNSGICGISEPADGTLVTGEPSGDCQKKVCDGAGNIKSIADDSDLPIISNQCRTAMCVAGIPMTPAKPKATACNDNGHVCDGSGSCVDTFCVLRLDGVTSAAAALTIEERRLDGSLVGTTPLPTSDSGISGGNLAITESGSASSEGGLSLSGDGRYLVLAGYDTMPGTLSVKGTAGINRVVARVAADGTVNSSTSISIATAFTQDNVRSATSQDGSAFWVSGAGMNTTGGIWYVTLGGGGLVNIVNNPSDTRWLQVINGQLYGTATVGSTLNGVFTVGSGLPTLSGQTATILPGLPTASGPGPLSFVFFDRDSTAGFDTLYISDDGNTANRGVQKWTLVTTGMCGTTPAPCWNKATTFNLTPAVKFKGLAGTVVNGNVFLMATTDEGTTARLVTFVDSGSGAPTTTIFTPLTANQIYRGVALSPHL